MSNSHPRNQKKEAKIALIVTSDSRTKATDTTGQTAIDILKAEGHQISYYTIVPNKIEKINLHLETVFLDPLIDVIITSGGTGISIKDKTVDTVKLLLEFEIPGFGELFRRLSYDEIGVHGVTSRATAGVKNNKLVFCLPGSKGAMRMALQKIIIPVISHMLWELNRK